MRSYDVIAISWLLLLGLLSVFAGMALLGDPRAQADPLFQRVFGVLFFVVLPLLSLGAIGAICRTIHNR